MSIYKKDGTLLTQAYGVSGDSLFSAYNKNGVVVFCVGDLIVMNYNVGQWYIGDGSRVPTNKKSEYYALQNGTFENNPADVLFLQEYLSTWCADNSPSSELLSPYFDYQQSTNDTSAYKGHSICTNGYQISNYTSHNFTTNKGNYPTFESATITVGGKTITIVNTHNDFVLSYQEQEVTDLLAYLANLDYFILAGDFNVDLDTEDTTSDQYLNNVKRFVDAGYHVGNCVIDWIPTYFGTSSPTGGKFTDNVITSANIEIERISAYTAKLTDNIGDKIDHLPFIAVLTIN